MAYKTLKYLLPFMAWWPIVNRQSLRADLLAGITGAVIVLPQGVAFAIIAGLPPEYGLYSAIVVTITGALFGSSRHLVSGPATPISIVLFSTVSLYAEPNTAPFIGMVLTLTFMAGLYQLVFGLLRLGAIVNFVSHSVVVGFTAGAAILITTSQIANITGLDIPKGNSFLHTWEQLLFNLSLINLYTLFIAAFTLITAVLIKKWLPHLPFMLIAMISGSLLCLLVNGEAHDVHMLGEIPTGLPPLSMPDLSWPTLRMLAPEALAVALLGLIEAISIGRSIALQSGQHINSNQECIGQGLSNITGSFFSSFAGSGSFTRSAINHQAGAVTPLSSVFSATAVALTLMFIAPLTAYLPMPVMGGIILLVAWNLIDIPHIRHIVRASRTETNVLLVTFLATLFLALEFAIYAGVLLSMFFYLQRTAHPKIFSIAPDPMNPHRKFCEFTYNQLPECPQLKIIRIDGSLFFGAVNHVAESLQRIAEKQPETKHMLIIASSINFIDIAGAQMLVSEARYWQERGGGLYLCELKQTAEKFLRKGGYLAEFGEHNVFGSKKDTVPLLMGRFNQAVCSQCSVRIFNECQHFSPIDNVKTEVRPAQK